jgi:hypothetical protein
LPFAPQEIDVAASSIAATSKAVMNFLIICGFLLSVLAHRMKEQKRCRGGAVGPKRTATASRSGLTVAE